MPYPDDTFTKINQFSTVSTPVQAVVSNHLPQPRRLCIIMLLASMFYTDSFLSSGTCNANLTVPFNRRGGSFLHFICSRGDLNIKQKDLTPHETNKSL